MTRAEIVAAIAEVARRHLAHVGELPAEARLVEDLGLDSLRLQILAAEVENRFEIAFAPEEEAAIRTVGELAAAVEAKLAV
jgi:acyl carrier protein